MLFSVLFSENSRIREISQNLGAGDSSAVGRSRRKCPYFHCTRVSEDSVNPISIFVESLLGRLIIGHLLLNQNKGLPLFAVWVRQSEARVALELSLVACRSGCIHAEYLSVYTKPNQTKNECSKVSSRSSRTVIRVI